MPIPLNIYWVEKQCKKLAAKNLESMRVKGQESHNRRVGNPPNSPSLPPPIERVELRFDIFWQILFLADPDYRSILVPSSIVQSLSLSIWHLHRWFDARWSEKHLRICGLCTRIINRWTDTWSQWCIYDDGLFGQRHPIHHLQNKHLRETVKFYTTDLLQGGFFPSIFWRKFGL